VASENGLDAGAQSAASREKVLDELQAAILIEAVPADVKNDRGVTSIFTIRYRDKNRTTAIGVVNTLMNLLIEDTGRASREGTDKATHFLDDRIKEYEARLEKAETALAEFQRSNSGKLPGSEGNYFERIQREREALEKTRRDLRLAQSKHERLQRQLTSEAPMMADDVGRAKEPRPDSIDARIRDQRAQLDSLLLKYTDRHPEVIAMRESLARLQAQRADQLRALGISDPDQQVSALGANPVYQAVQIALNEVDVEIATLEADERDRQQKLHDLQSLIAEVPGVEAELARLNRDYSVIKDQYQALIQSRERQQLSEQASATDQVEFRVLNPPDADLKPVAPKRLMLLAGVLAAALGVGAALSYLLAQLKPVFDSVRALSEATGFPVIGLVSRIAVDPRATSRSRLAVAAFSIAVGTLILIVGGLALYERVGPGIHSLVGGA
jgi:polysaccharide chain length determinant protein (PEP-CTERM system associated)